MSTTLQLKNRKRKDKQFSREKMAKEMNGRFTEEESQMAINIHKSSSTSLVAWEMEIRT